MTAAIITGAVLVVFAVIRGLGGREADSPDVPAPRLPEFEVAPAVPTAHQALDALLTLQARLRATGSTPDEVSALCDPFATLLIRPEAAK